MRKAFCPQRRFRKVPGKPPRIRAAPPFPPLRPQGPGQPEKEGRGVGQESKGQDQQEEAGGIEPGQAGRSLSSQDSLHCLMMGFLLVDLLSQTFPDHHPGSIEQSEIHPWWAGIPAARPGIQRQPPEEGGQIEKKEEKRPGREALFNHCEILHQQILPCS